MLWIISGPSSAGKSTFLESQRCRDITLTSSNTPVRFAFESDWTTTLNSSDCLFHYNILRAAFRRRRRSGQNHWRRLWQKFFRIAAATAPLESTAFTTDPVWRQLLETDVSKTAVVLVASQERILDRISKRDKVEEEMPSGMPNKYSREEWKSLYEMIDVAKVYQAWVDELEKQKIEYLLLNSDESDFRLMPRLP